jgi:pyruvate dehydrogenase E2 component (dihydrolipoamide acetyltransferase)
MTVRRWRKKPGESVAKGDVLLEVESDEGLVEVEANVSGTLTRVLVGEGTTIAVNTPVAVIGDAGVASEQAGRPEENKPAGDGSGKRPAGGNVIPILMPKAGQTMEEGVLIKWHKKPGDMIAKGEVIFEIETDKATMDVEATDAGRLARIVVQEGGMAKVMEPVAYLADNDADVDAFVAGRGGAASVGEQGQEGTEEATKRQSDEATKGWREGREAGGHEGPGDDATKRRSDGGGRVKASPAARKIAGERGIDLATVGAGSGPGGRILSTDVPLAARAAAPAPAAPVAVAPAAPAMPVSGEVVRKRMSQMRKAIAKNLSLSKQTIPHFYIKQTIDAQPLFDFYQGEKAKYPCSINDVIIMACARAMMEFPAFRSQIVGDEIVTYPSANIGVAVGLDDGLVVPVLIAAEKMTLKQIGAESKRIAAAAKAGKIEGMGKGLFTISNMGMFGVEEFQAIINPPETAILAVATIREQVIVSGGTMRPGKVMTLTLSVDHRVIDGVLAARFLARLKELLEWPGQMV